MASLFGANPFSTPVGQRIEKATDGNLPSEDWAANIEICDIINDSDEGPKDGAKAIRKRLSGNKNYNSVLLTLTVLETCVKNCGHRFHVLLAKKEFLDELVEILNPKNNTPQVVQDKILSLIQEWADAFCASPDLSYVMKTYKTLRAQGIEFPAMNLDTLSPIYTPDRPPVVPPQPAQPVHPMQSPVGPVLHTPEQLGNIRFELDIIRLNITLMSNMLTEMIPGQAEQKDLKFLHCQELNRTCRVMQQRIVELIQTVTNEEVTGLLLSVNDDLNNVFTRYNQYERFRQNTTQQAEPSIAVPVEPQQPAAVEPLPTQTGRMTTAWPEDSTRVETWPSCSETEKQVLSRKIKLELNDSPLVTSPSSLPKTTETNKQQSKRVCPSESERSSKRQRIAHINKNNNIVMKDSVNKSSTVDTPKTNPGDDRNDVSPPEKKEVVESTTTGNLENSINGVNSLDSPEFMRKYKAITTYEQRCLYKADFKAEYEVYKALKEKVDSVRRKFTELQNKQQQFPKESSERKAVDKEILQLFEKIQKDTLWQQTKKQYRELHAKLSYIKGLITAYDNSTASN